LIIDINQIKSKPWFQKNLYLSFGNFIQTPSGNLHYVDFPGIQFEGVKSPQDNHSTIPTIFIHGHLGWSYEWRHILESFPCRGIAPDLLGFGLSIRPNLSLTLEQHSKSLALLASELNLTRFNIVAHGFGVGVATDLISKFPTLVHKVIFISACHPDGVERQAPLVSNLKRFLRFASMAVYRYFGFSSTDVNRFLWDQIATLSLADQQAFFHMQVLEPSNEAVSFPNYSILNGSSQSIEKAVSILKNIPTLFISGKLDSITGEKHLSLWGELLPEAPSVILSKSGHWPHLDNARTTVDIVHQFISDH
jgi:pimeloyl-ACP methyl ester carboxylesterase